MINGSLWTYDQTIHHVSRSSSPVTALNSYSNDKVNKYKTILNENNVNFAPIVVSALGFEHESFVAFVDQMKTYAKNSDRHVSVKFFYSCLSVKLAVYRGKNFAMC